MTLTLRLERGAHTFLLEGQPLARGGEAAIYVLPHQPTLVAKVYHEPTAAHAAKVAAMIAAPPADPMAGRGHVSIAWPLDRLLEAGGSRFLGYVMPRVDRVWPILEFYNPGARLRLCPLFHYGYLLRTACNLAAAVRALHERGYVVGDLNESNILVNNMALVTLVDTDSFQVPGAGLVHRCPVGKPEYTPPELQGARFADFDRGPEHDAFALAVLIFQLLMQGIHPFAGRYTGQGEPGGLGERIAAGHWPYASSRRVPFAPNPHAPPFETLPPLVQALLRRCFEDGHARSSLRPTAASWHHVLLESEKALVACPANPKQHVFHREQKSCPWCSLAAVQGRDLFPSAEDVQAGRVGTRAATTRATEVVQVALAPAPLGHGPPSRDIPAAPPARPTPGSVPVIVPPVSATSSLPAESPRLPSQRTRPSDLEPSAVRPPVPGRRAIPWPLLIGGGGLVAVLTVVLFLVLGGKRPAVDPAGPGERVENVPSKQAPENPPKQEIPKQEIPKQKEEAAQPVPGPTIAQERRQEQGLSITTLNLPASQIVNDLVWTHDGQAFFALTSEGVLSRIALNGFLLERKVTFGGPCCFLALSAEGPLVAMKDLQEVWVCDPVTLDVKKKIAAPSVERVLSAPGLKIALATSRRQPSNDGTVTILDLVKGTQVGQFEANTRYSRITPDGKYYFAVGGGASLSRYSINGTTLTLEQRTGSMGSNAQSVNVSPDSKYVCLPCGGGNSKADRPYSTCVYPVGNLNEPEFTLPSGGYPHVVGFDPAGGLVYTQNAETQLLVYSITAIKRGEYNLTGRDARADGSRQFVPHPRGKRLLVLTGKRLLFVELEGTGN
ncbi:MAG TPA: hypothetical protein VEL76_15365 [Gemmataceae bacterium]|nr:hypothetical protein [Gemmataceae bacterium]